jgi:hypothetical protein
MSGFDACSCQDAYQTILAGLETGRWSQRESVVSLIGQTRDRRRDPGVQVDA